MSVSDPALTPDFCDQAKGEQPDVVLDLLRSWESLADVFSDLDASLLPLPDVNLSPQIY